MPDRQRNRRIFDWFFRPAGLDEDAPLSAEASFAEVLAELPAVERSALALSEIGGLEPDEIAARLGTDVDVAETVLGRARTTARMKLRDRRAGLAALLPWQWLLPSGAPAARAAGVVAAAVVGTTVAVTTAVPDASADRPTPVVRAEPRSDQPQRAVRVARSGLSRPVAVAAATAPAPAAEGRSVLPAPRRAGDAAVRQRAAPAPRTAPAAQPAARVA
ncbi:MAG TPA: sigma-70 region 4 domain-containing protein, partial [Gaiellaceae bacterium]|nr:sigma-70 region 4 domain-containing protein [Gaiellaceae bacterium]